ncbi:catalase [Streptomyces sp. NPDC003233]
MQPIGLLTLDRNPLNFFAEAEQVAFHPGHLAPASTSPTPCCSPVGYLDTQITRLGGPDFAQIPINRPHAPVNDMLRDGMHQTAVHQGVAPYRPDSLDGGCPFVAGADAGAFVEAPVRVPEATKVREAPASFDDRSPGVLSGNVIQVPIDVPVTVCGDSINLIGLLNPTVGNSCVNQ